MPSLSSLEISRVQQALAHKGFDPGLIDGIWGRRTELAVRRFQLARGLTVDGIVGPNTRLALFGSAAPPANPLSDPGLPWLQEARRLIGLKEGPGAADNPVLLDWGDDLDVHFPKDSIAWCGLFVGHCIASTLSTEPLPTNPLGARNWARWGAPCTPQPGALLVFWRGDRNGWKGHVGFYAGEERKKNAAAASVFHVLGGNQSDQVCVSRIAADRLLAARWPATAPPPAGAPVLFASGRSVLSTDEA
jgi:uncharacterized protein (TIGR02594 family)